jgi:very-short-patch-repair endonuclease
LPYYKRWRRYYRRSDPAKFEKAREMRSNPTPAEEKMYNILYTQVVPKFPQCIFYRQSVQYGYTLDFYCPKLRLGIEVDGYVHDEQKQYDSQRDNNLARHGIDIFRFSNDNVLYNSQAVASDLCQIIGVRARHRGLTANHEYSTTTAQTPITATTLQTKSGCFIATATYGTPLAQEIKILRRFRDSRMEPNLIVRHFVTLYYNASPPLARVISRNKKMKAFVRLSLKPIIRLFASNNSA